MTTKKKKKIHSLKATAALLALAVAKDVALPSVAHAAQKPWLYVRERCENTKKTTRPDTQITGVDGDWLTEGTEAYKVAKKIFDTFTQEFGTSGAFAAGALASVKGESGFIPDRGETYWNAPYGIYTFGMDGEEPDPNMGPSTQSQEASHGRDHFGGGLFQFTKWTKMIESKAWRRLNPEQGWAPENQVDAVLELEFWNRAIESYMYRPRIIEDDYSRALFNAEEFISTNDPEQAALYFMMAYERPESPHYERLEWAKQANAVFNADDVQADKSKWRFDTNGDVTVNKKKKKKKCSVDGRAGSSGNVTHADWGNDGTGSIPAGTPLAFRPDNVPEDMKPYILDPQAVGMSFGSSDGWTNPGSQCANFASSFLYALWEKDGQRNPSAAGAAGELYGGKFADTYAAKYGGSSTTSPSKGAIASVLPPSTFTNSEYGHVWIVCHVFENGDTLIVEQNFSSGGVYSGAAGHEYCTWNYRIITQSELDQNAVRYFTPGDVGYSPSSNISSGE